VKLLFNGRPFDPKDFVEQITKSLMQQAGAHLQEKLSSIRHPETGEFPTVLVTATGLNDIKAQVEGSPELLAIVHERLGATAGIAENEDGRSDMGPVPPRVFLSYAFEDSELAGRIAHTLQAQGIETFWAEWSMGAGDSLIQKINEWLEGCTHFVVLLTPVAIRKPWVRQEMDAALIRHITDRCTFIALRQGLPARELSPLLAPFLSPELNDFNRDITQLVNDIHGVSRKPPLGAAPTAVVGRPVNSGYSAAAMAVARVFVERSENGMWADPQVRVEDLPELSGLTEEDAEDAIHELSSFVEVHHRMYVLPKAEFYAAFDAYFCDWNPAEDALLLATAMINDRSYPAGPKEIGNTVGWPPRRLNPAIAYLAARNLVTSHDSIGSAAFNVYLVEANGATRRFVKSRN
jgi:hypothetical protein